MAINRAKVLDAAQKYRRKGNLDKAIREYRLLIEDDPTDMRTLLILADLYVKTQNMESALDAYKAIAYYYLKDDIYDKAVGVFKQALGLSPGDPTLRRDLGEAYHRMGRLKEAVGEYHHAQRIYEERGDVQNQRDILERMVRLEPEEPALRIKLAEHYTRLKMHEEAIGLFQYAAQQFEDDGRIDDYLKVMERVIFLRPRDMALRKRVAQYYLEQGDYQKALKHLRACFEASNTDIDTLRMMSVAFEQLKDVQKAVLVYSQLAKLYRDRGDASRSHEIYTHILRLDPNNQDARKMLEYDARQRQQQQQRAQAPAPRRPSAEDSSPSAFDTRNLAPAPHNTQPADPPSLPEVEFLDDDLADVLAPAVAHTPAPQRPQQPLPSRPSPPTPQPRRDDLLSFAADALDELGDIGLDAVQDSPTNVSATSSVAVPDEPPLMEIEPLMELELEPLDLEPEISAVDDDLNVRQVVDEARVFIKYGLKDRAIQALLDVLKRYPDALSPRQEIAALYESRGEAVLAADQHLEMARVLRHSPEQSAAHLEHAARLFEDRARVAMIAEAMGLPFSAGASLAPRAPQPVTPAPVRPEPMAQPMLAGELGLDLPSDAFDLGGAFDAISQESSSSHLTQEEQLLTSSGEDELEMDTGQIDAQAVALEDIPELEMDTDEVLLDEEIELSDVDDLDLLSFADDVPALPSSNLPQETELSSLAFSASEAESVFDDLFGDSGAYSPLKQSFSGSQDLTDLADVDFLIEQGMVSEAEDAFSRVASRNPQSSSLEQRRLNLETLRRENPFSASRSISKQFAYGSVDEMFEAQQQGVGLESSVPSLIGAGDNAVNTNFELGAAYLEMGLFDEAIEEFVQSLHDPDVAESASYNIALCEFRRGNPRAARERLEALLRHPTLPSLVRASATNLLARV